MKQLIRADDNLRPYEYLRPLVDCLIDAGNRPTQWNDLYGPFYPVKEGWECSLTGPLDWALLEDNFEIPKTITYNAETDEIFDESSWATIAGSQPLKGDVDVSEH